MIRFRALRSPRGRLLAGLWWAAISLVPGEMVRIAMISHGHPPAGYLLVLTALFFGVLFARIPWLTRRPAREGEHVRRLGN